MADLTFDVKVRSITKTHREKEDEELDQQKLFARDEDGVVTIILTAPSNSFEGIKAGSTIKISVANPQTTL